MKLFRRRCPACGEKGLERHTDRRVADGMKDGLKVNPAWLWSRCVRCDARFKERHYGNGQLVPVSEQEWGEEVAD